MIYCTFLVFLCLFFNPSFQQVSFLQPFSRGTTCTPTITSAGLEVNCNGKGFYVFDFLPHAFTTKLNIKILSNTAVVVLGLGQQPDGVTCLTSMFPSTGQTWTSCTGCDKVNCNFDKIVTYTATGYTTSSHASRINTGKNYLWQFIPPNCPSTSKCWKTQISSKN